MATIRIDTDGWGTRIFGLVIILFILIINFYYLNFAWSLDILRLLILLVLWLFLGTWSSALGLIFGVALLVG
jgi:hypothetical protein